MNRYRNFSRSAPGCTFWRGLHALARVHVWRLLFHTNLLSPWKTTWLTRQESWAINGYRRGCTYWRGGTYWRGAHILQPFNRYRQTAQRFPLLTTSSSCSPLPNLNRTSPTHLLLGFWLKDYCNLGYHNVSIISTRTSQRFLLGIRTARPLISYDI